jgi:predicted ArsR family transcriptional regulator
MQKLSHREQILLQTIASEPPDEKGWCRYTLRHHLGIGESTLRRHLQLLHNRGFVHVNVPDETYYYSLTERGRKHYELTGAYGGTW